MGKKTKSRARAGFSDPLALTLSLTLALLPVVMLPNISDMYALPKASFLYISTAVLVFLYIVRSLRSEKLVIYRSPLDLPVGLILLVAALAVAFSDSPVLGLVGKYKHYESLPALFCYALIYFFTIQTIRDEKSFEKLIKTMAAGFAAVAIYGLAQVLSFDFSTVLRFESRVHSSLGNPILLGAYLVIMLPLLFSLARNAEEESWRLFSWALILVGGVNLIFTESRGAWLGLIAAVLAMFFIARRGGTVKPKKTKTRSKIQPKNANVIAVGALSLAVMLVIGLFLIAPDNQFGKRVSSTFSLSEGSAATRIETWKATLNMISDKPVFGFGLERMGYWFPSYKTDRHTQIAPNSVADRTHNDLLQVAVDMGIAGLLLYFWIFLIAIYGLFKDRGFSRGSPYSIGLSGALVGYITQGQTGVPAMFITPIVWSLLAAATNIKFPKKKKELKVPGLIKPGVFVPIATIALILFVAFAVWPVTADYHMSKGHQLTRTSLDAAAPEFEAAIKLFPYQPEYKKAAAEFYLDYASYYQNAIFARRAALIAEQGLAYNAKDFELAYYAGEASLLEYRIDGGSLALENAEKYFKQAEVLWPSQVLVKSKLLDIARIKGDSKRAEELAKEIIDMGFENPRLYYLLAVYAQQRGDNDQAKRYFNKIEEIDPSFLLKVKAD